MILRRFRNWIRVISPADYLMVAVLGLAAIVWASTIIRLELGDRTAWESGVGFSQFLVCIGTAAYVAIRFMYFHPIENRPYGNWLDSSPWRYPLALPLGPATIVWQDVVCIAVLTAVCTTVYFPLPSVPILFLLLYCAAQAASLCRLGIYWTAYTNLFLLGCMVLAVPNTWTVLTLAGLAYLAVYIAMKQALKRFPFTREERTKYLQPASVRYSQISPIAGWPTPPIANERRNWSISQLNSALIGVVFAWLLFCVCYRLQIALGSDVGSIVDMRKVLPMIVGSATLYRIFVYTFGYPPPISIFGRVATRRLFIPGYDVVWAVPLAVVALACLLTIATDYLGVATYVATPIIAGTTVWLMLALPPTHEVWQLTGHHRIAYRLRTLLLDQTNASKRV